jgi:Domain of unknown function (DUF4184)
MPFTLAHPAAALPFRKTRLVFSAVVVGSVAPDFEYFLRLAPQGRYFHSLPGLVFCTLPVALAVLWLFHRSAKFAVVRLLPTGVQQRLPPDTGFPFGGLRRFALLALSVLVGAVTHILWDSFTHRGSWAVKHLWLLHQQVVLPWPIHRSVAVCIVLQHLSGLIGVGILVFWFLAWFRRTPPVHRVEAPLSRETKAGILLSVFGLTLCGALVRTALFRPASPISDLGVFVVTWLALLWWALVALGWWWRPRQVSGQLRSTPCAAAANPASPAGRHRRSPATALPEP